MTRALERRDLLRVAAAGAVGFVAVPARAYGLDGQSRRVPDTRIKYCPRLEFVHYRGTHVRYSNRAEVYVEFAERLERFEALAVAVGREFYGRGPVRLVHLGTRLCRRTRKDPRYFSEHAFGNAIDFVGFDFARLERGRPLPPGTHPAFRDFFSVRVGRHWKPQPGVVEIHSRFLHALMRRLVARRDIFRVLLGPANPGHTHHFHFDCAPERRVEVFADEAE